MLITLQYLEDCPELFTLSKEAVIDKLKYAFDKLPITHLIIGWHIPNQLLEACKKVCESNKTKFIRWQPILTGDGEFIPKPEWHVISLSGRKIPGYLNMSEFTFVCPNWDESTDSILEHIEQLTNLGIYDGLFLDRVRYPSPASNLLHTLGCFCESCQQKAMLAGLDLKKFQASLQSHISSESGKLELIGCVLGNFEAITNEPLRESVTTWMKFREDSITGFVNKVCEICLKKGLDIGLDCFSPSLTNMVGQNLYSLSQHVNWIKIMSYAHALGPAGIPFEIIDFFNDIKKSTNLTEKEILNFLSSSLVLPLPESIEVLQHQGISTHALELEVKKVKNSVKIPVLAGLEIVDIPGVTTLNNEQLILDHKAVFEAGIAGLSISWDLWHIPNHRLDLLSSIWLK